MMGPAMSRAGVSFLEIVRFCWVGRKCVFIRGPGRASPGCCHAARREQGEPRAAPAALRLPLRDRPCRPASALQLARSRELEPCPRACHPAHHPPHACAKLLRTLPSAARATVRRADSESEPVSPSGLRCSAVPRHLGDEGGQGIPCVSILSGAAAGARLPSRKISLPLQTQYAETLHGYDRIGP